MLFSIEDLKGQFQEVRGHAVILSNVELKDSEERFYICAHELGHAIFHRGLSSYYVSTRTSRSKSESEERIALLLISLCLFIKKTTINTPEKLRN